jgi:predicted PurR-regulated permease PerM
MSLLARYLLFPFVYVLLWAIFLACVVKAVAERLGWRKPSPRHIP